MEHSLLHGLQISGLIIALGGVLFRLLVLLPVLRSRGISGAALMEAVNRWIVWAALAGSFGALLDLFVQTAELDARTVYAGVDLGKLFEFVVRTEVGRLSAAKAALLAIAAWFGSRGKPRDLTVLASLLGALVTSTLVSHSAALPAGRAAAIATQAAHVGFAACWLGMLFFVNLAARHLAEGSVLLVRIVERFSPFALVGVVVISGSGVLIAFRFINSPKAVLTSAYGLTLALKILLLLLVGAAGFLNWRSIRPRLRAGAGGVRAMFVRLLEFELSAGVLLLLVAGILGAISPPSEPQVAQLTSTQLQALLSPRLPPARLVDPARFVGAAERTGDDLRYAEFTHQWSGVFVGVLGLCWLGQSFSKERPNLFARIWPAILLPFGIFIAVTADPEVWILRTYSVAEVLSNPQVLEHQIGALLVFALAVLGFRDRKRAPLLRPLGPAFPIVMICGSLMLLGHAHSNIGVSEELTNLINMEHAVIGSFGLIAGMSRWFEIRQLPGRAALRYAWPLALITLGVFMAFFYRELTPAPAPDFDPSYSMISRLHE